MAHESAGRNDHVMGDEREGTADFQPWLDKALTIIVDSIMDGNKWPMKADGRRWINLIDILSDQESQTLAYLLALWNKDNLLYGIDVRNAMERIVKDRIQDSHWHVDLANDLFQSDAADCADRR
jgi:hypothetical protein